MVGFLEILGGLALFLYGIRMLNAGMEKLTGEQIQKWLERMTRGRFRSALFGTIATALIQLNLGGCQHSLKAIRGGRRPSRSLTSASAWAQLLVSQAGRPDVTSMA